MSINLIEPVPFIEIKIYFTLTPIACVFVCIGIYFRWHLWIIFGFNEMVGNKNTLPTLPGYHRYFSQAFSLQKVLIKNFYWSIIDRFEPIYTERIWNLWKFIHSEIRFLKKIWFLYWSTFSQIWFQYIRSKTSSTWTWEESIANEDESKWNLLSKWNQL